MKSEIVETNRSGVYACPVKEIDIVKFNHCDIVKIGRKWLYFKCTAKTRCESFNMVMPLSLLFTLPDNS